ncbi:YsaB family lipoprotein [Mangrovibacter plantisponsor]|uniref:YsaB family lipoprotein n=1 Tax=Mangrovibacter plantisponsor TaxID=451513 RepID=UPI000D70B909|nr:YsaB family lipoprotein [Mangrovibacter plantisponsor]
MMTALFRWPLAGLLLPVSLLLAGCQSASRPDHTTSRHFTPAPVEMMAAQCRDQVSRRYNTKSDTVVFDAPEAFQRSYEIRGATQHHERFTCTFDDSGKFMSLSMR